MDNNMQPFAPQPSSRPDQGGNSNFNQNPQNQGTQNQNQSEQSQIDPQLPPAMDNQQGQNFFQQGTTSNVENPTGPTIHNTGVQLESPVLAPTHFDNIKDPNIQGQTMISSGTVTNKPMDEKKLFKTLSIVFGALAFIGIILGIWSLVSNISTSNKLAAAQADLKNKNAIIAKVEADTGAVITSPDNVPAYTAITDTIYIPEWGISFKIPTDLENVSYTVDQKYRPQICFTAHKTGIKYFPAFADIDQNTATLGCVTRVATYEGDSDKDTGATFGQKIYTYGDYNYFYTAPTTHFSQDASEQGLEDTAVQIIKNMVSGNISHYE
ncbi:hypothetical protein IJ098_03425 [Candidatus Saccharibacteria bacterium]|nr:hypothetical protein [Candidatus Saccharibacteria bacterium]